MNFLKIFSVFATFELFLCGSVFAASAYPGLIESTQPDGSVVYIRNVGNARVHYTVTEDDELIVRDSAGFWNYSDESGKPTGVKVHKKGERGESELKFLKGRDSKKIREDFVKEKKRKSHEKESARKARMQSSSVEGVSGRRSFRAAAVTPVNSVEKIATRPVYDPALTLGEIRGLVILVEFPDVAFKSSTPQADYDRYMNEEGYHENGMRWSARDYFVSNSMGLFKPHFDVAAPVTLSKNRNYYGSQDYPDEAFFEAINIIKSRGDIDFTNYDNDGDHYIDFVYMFYAGVGAADTDVQGAIWPQSVTFEPISIGKRYYLYKYACSNEISGSAYGWNKNTTTLAGVGIFVHEFSHVLGLPDFYDTWHNGTEGGNEETPYIWDLMDMGEYNSYAGMMSLPSTAPPRLNAFERYSVGWLNPRVLEKVNDEITLEGIDKNDGILIPSNKPNEYFFLDYRAKYDSIAPVPQSGMLIWRVSYDTLAWWQNEVNVETSNRFWLYRADGDAGYSFNYDALSDPYLKGDPFPGSKKVTQFDKFVTYAGDSLGLRIYDIRESDTAVHFRVKWDQEEIPSSSSVVASSSSEAISSSSEPLSSSSAIESSSTVALPERIQVASSMRMEGSILHVSVALAGEKELRLFDMQGHELYAEKIAGENADVRLDRLGRGAFVARLTSRGRLIAVKKLTLGN